MRESDTVYLDFIEKIITDNNLIIVGLNLESKNAKLLNNCLKVLFLALDSSEVASKCLKPLYEIPPQKSHTHSSPVADALSQ